MNVKKLGLTKEILEKLYLKEEKSTKEISVIYSCCSETIVKRLRKFKIPVRLPAHLGLSKKAKKKISIYRKGIKLSEEHKQNISLGGKGKHTGKNNGNWKGGKIKVNGYILIRKPKHPKSKNGYIGEHIIVMEKSIGRFLKKDEIVHHKNKIRNDNRIENLQLLKNQSEHIRLHNLQRGKRNLYEKNIYCGVNQDS